MELRQNFIQQSVDNRRIALHKQLQALCYRGVTGHPSDSFATIA
jgi:hypothetical protein